MDIRHSDRTQLRDIRAFTHQFVAKDDRLAWAGYLATFAVFLGGLAATIAAVQAGLWALALVTGLLTAFAIIRLYVIQHDCGHLSYLSTRRLNDLAGHGASMVSLSPYTLMQENHNRHHAHVGNLDHREDGEVYTMTLREWRAAGVLGRLMYRLYRNPLVMIAGGALYVYFIRYRWPKNALEVNVTSVLLHNLALAAWVGLLFALAGWTGVGVWFVTAWVAGMLGVFQVYLQHNFEDTYWDRRPDLDPQIAALQGSSALNLGWLWDLGTGNIAYHDVHHFNPRIPLYNLRRCHFALDAMMPMRRIGWAEALRSFRLKLWDEDAERLVPFPPATQRVVATA